MASAVKVTKLIAAFSFGFGSMEGLLALRTPDNVAEQKFWIVAVASVAALRLSKLKIVRA